MFCHSFKSLACDALQPVDTNLPNVQRRFFALLLRPLWSKVQHPDIINIWSVVKTRSTGQARDPAYGIIAKNTLNISRDFTASGQPERPAGSVDGSGDPGQQVGAVVEQGPALLGRTGDNQPVETVMVLPFPGIKPPLLRIPGHVNDCASIVYRQLSGQGINRGIHQRRADIANRIIR